MATTTRRSNKKVSVDSKLRIRVQAYDHRVLDMSVKQIMDTSLRFGLQFSGPVPMPVSIKKQTVNRSTFVHKDSREQFEMRIHKRIIDVHNPTKQVVEALTNISLPAGVSVTVKVIDNSNKEK